MRKNENEKLVKIKYLCDSVSTLAKSLKKVLSPPTGKTSTTSQALAEDVGLARFHCISLLDFISSHFPPSQCTFTRVQFFSKEYVYISLLTNLFPEYTSCINVEKRRMIWWRWSRIFKRPSTNNHSNHSPARFFSFSQISLLASFLVPRSNLMVLLIGIISLFQLMCDIYSVAISLIAVLSFQNYF